MVPPTDGPVGPGPAGANTGAARTPPGEADLAAVRTVPVGRRPNKVRAEEFCQPPGSDRSFAGFLAALPDILVARDLLAVIDAVVAAKRADRGVVVMLGGHVVKTGLAPLLIDLMRRGIITHLAMNGSAAIHDYEIARFGGTSEDVATGLRDGTFGMAEETGRGMNEAFVRGMREGWGMGESVGRDLDARDDLVHPELSVLLNARRLGVPATVHAALGAEIIHQHPAASGAAIGDTSHRDFRRLAHSLQRLHDGGVVLNLGSAVIMPEVFLKALTIARNLHEGRPQGFVTADLDMTRHYRPRVNVVQRPTLQSGKGYEITGHHEIMVPLLAWGIVTRMEQSNG
ncbi:MAG: GSU2086 family protein [Gemmatimonadaceae bacterium]